MVNKNIRITKLPRRGKNLNFFQTPPLQKTILVKKPPPATPFPLHFPTTPQHPTTSHTRNFMLYTYASLDKISPLAEGLGAKAPNKRSASTTARQSSTILHGIHHHPRQPSNNNTVQPQQTARSNTVYSDSVGKR